MPPLDSTKPNIFRFIALTFGISWLIALILYIQHIPFHSKTANLLITLFYMSSPGISAVVLSYFDKQSIWSYINWRGVHWRQIVWLPLIFLGFIVASFLVVYLLGNILGIAEMGVLEWSSGSVQYRLGQFSHSKPRYSEATAFSSLILFLGGLGSTILAGFTINALKAFVEELGWRGYLYEQIRHWGLFKSSLFTGVLMGIWYAPLVVLGLNFPTKTLAGIGLMTLSCIAASLLLTLARVRTGSVLGSAFLSGMFKGCAMLFFVYVVSGTELFSTSVGIAGIGGMLLMAGLLNAFWRDKQQNSTE